MKTVKKEYRANTPSGGTLTYDIFTASDFEFIEVHALFLKANSFVKIEIIQIDTGLVMFTDQVSTAGSGCNYFYTRPNELVTASAASPTPPKKLDVPNGCVLRATLTNVSALADAAVAHGISFANTQ